MCLKDLTGMKLTKPNAQMKVGGAVLFGMIDGINQESGNVYRIFNAVRQCNIEKVDFDLTKPLATFDNMRKKYDCPKN